VRDSLSAKLGLVKASTKAGVFSFG